jgi:hypothetical protein
MWEMSDEVELLTSKIFFAHMFRKREHSNADFKDSAKALNLAIKKMRKQDIPPKWWIPFIHIGA